MFLWVLLFQHRDRVPSMNLYEAWEMRYSGKGVKVAGLDNGIDMGHPDLMGNYVSYYAYHDCVSLFHETFLG